MEAEYKINLAKNFVEINKQPDVTKWSPHFNDSDAQYLAIYENLINHKYGEVRKEKNGGNNWVVTAETSTPGHTIEFHF
jgi:hypothetical protein